MMYNCGHITFSWWSCWKQSHHFTFYSMEIFLRKRSCCLGSWNVILMSKLGIVLSTVILLLSCCVQCFLLYSLFLIYSYSEPKMPLTFSRSLPLTNFNFKIYVEISNPDSHNTNVMNVHRHFKCVVYVQHS